MRSKGQGCIWKRQDFYVFQYRDLTGKRKAEAIRDEKGNLVKSRKEAERLIEAKQKELAKIKNIETKQEYLFQVAENKKIITDKEKIPLPSLWDAYLKSPTRPDSGKKTLKGYHDSVVSFLCWMQENHVEIKYMNEVTEDIAFAFSSFYWNTGVSERTYNAKISALKLVFKVLQKENPFQQIRKKTEQQQSRQAFTVEQLKSISETIDNPSYHMLYKPEMRLMMLLMLYTGCRGEDACLMRWDAVNLAKRVITYIPIKTARKRPVPVAVPIAEPLFVELSKVESDKGKKGYVLPAVADRYKRNPCGISLDVSKLLENAGIRTQDKDCTARRKRAVVRYSMHSFRHTFCTLAINSGIQITAIQSIVGHSTSAMTSHYSHVSLETKENVIKCLPSFSGSNKEEKVFSEELERLITSKGKSIVSALEKILSADQKHQLFILLEA